MNTERDILRDRKYYHPLDKKYHSVSYEFWVLLKPIVTSRGKSKAGEAGVFMSNADGTGRFFPYNGGVAMQVPIASVKRVRLPPMEVRKVTRSRRLQRTQGRKVTRVSTRSIKRLTR